MNSKFHIEVDCIQSNHHGQFICGDVFISKKIKEESRTIIVLSDGMGSGVKANVLATLTSSMAINFTAENKEVRKTAEIIMNTLPVCSVRKISYSTFTIVDIEYDGTTRIVEYDNPDCLIMRGTKIFDPGWEDIELSSPDNKGKRLRSCSFVAEKEDRICIWSDGVVQSGMGTHKFPFGWGTAEAQLFVERQVTLSSQISARRLARKVVNAAINNDGNAPKDDTSCAVVYFRKPRKLIICSGPPFDQHKDLELAMMVKQFNGTKIICGGTTAEVIARELNLKLEPGFEMTDPELPPVSMMENIDLVTEGILTIGKVARLLEHIDSDFRPDKGPADQIVKHLLESDKIKIITGTRINQAHQDPTLPVELEIRRTVMKRIVTLLEEKFLKDIEFEFI